MSSDFLQCVHAVRHQTCLHRGRGERAKDCSSEHHVDGQQHETVTSKHNSVHDKLRRFYRCSGDDNDTAGPYDRCKKFTDSIRELY